MPSPSGALHRLCADLHSHSRYSDGTLQPRDLVDRAHAHGVALYALTDHDELGGQAEAAARAREIGLRLVHGVEISVSWAGRTVHIVGLGIDIDDTALQTGLASVRTGRIDRARRIAAQLDQVGITGSFDGALERAGNPVMVSRTHFARLLVDRGICRDVRDVFSRFLAEGKPGYVPHQWATLPDAVSWITGAGGVAVLAHPARYPIGDLALRELLTAFRACGGTAIEVSTSNHTAADRRRFADLAIEYGLEASAGSDFHGPGESEHAELGRVAELPDAVVPVWHRFA